MGEVLRSFLWWISAWIITWIGFLLGRWSVLGILGPEILEGYKKHIEIVEVHLSWDTPKTKTKIFSQKWWLEDKNSFWNGPFLGANCSIFPWSQSTLTWAFIETCCTWACRHFGKFVDTTLNFVDPKTRLQICPQKTFSETIKATDGTKMDLNIGETRVWRLDSGPSPQPCKRWIFDPPHWVEMIVAYYHSDLEEDSSISELLVFWDTGMAAKRIQQAGRVPPFHLWSFEIAGQNTWKMMYKKQRSDHLSLFLVGEWWIFHESGHFWDTIQSLETKIAHRKSSILTVFTRKDGDFPTSYISLPAGICFFSWNSIHHQVAWWLHSQHE